MRKKPIVFDIKQLELNRQSMMVNSVQKRIKAFMSIDKLVELPFPSGNSPVYIDSRRGASAKNHILRPTFRRLSPGVYSTATVHPPMSS